MLGCSQTGPTAQRETKMFVQKVAYISRPLHLAATAALPEIPELGGEPQVALAPVFGFRG